MDDEKRTTIEQMTGPAVMHERAERARIDAIRMDRPGLAKEAVAQMRKMTAEQFGSAAAQDATIAAYASGIHDVGPDKWEITGAYDGKDKDGARFAAPFVVSMEIVIGSLTTTNVSLKKRTYQDRRHRPTPQSK